MRQLAHDFLLAEISGVFVYSCYAQFSFILSGVVPEMGKLGD